MATIKQLKIGSTNYDIKALNASNQNQASAVVRDIQYGTSAPSGGSAGQMYLQYDSSTTNNPYVYAEDTIGNSQNAADNYYSKTETDQMLSLKQNLVKCDSSGLWTRIQIGRILILLCTNQSGGQLQFGVTFDDIPYVLTGAAQGSYGHGTVNQQVWDITKSSLRWDAAYGSSTKYGASLMVIGTYSGSI